MNYTVSWQPAAEQQLAQIWNNASDRGVVAAAADEIDRSLARNPHARSESRGGTKRIMFVFPLAIYFKVDDTKRQVAVYAVWRVGPQS